MSGKIHNAIKRFLIVVATILTGSLMMNMWVTKTDNWKLYLPIIILCIVLERFISMEENE